LKRNLISYNKFIKLQPSAIVFVDVSATTAAFIGTRDPTNFHTSMTTTVRRSYTWRTVVPTKAAAVAEMSTKTIIKGCNLTNLL